MRHSGSGGRAQDRLRESMNVRGAASDLGNDRIRVLVRMRPPHPHEHAEGVVEVRSDGRLILNRPDAPVTATEFKFDKTAFKQGYSLICACTVFTCACEHLCMFTLKSLY
eukprot:scaffold115964_cov18-Tisochrysis_lutea.AAC.1